MPRILIDAKHLVKIPRSHPEELNDVSLFDRLNQLEERMTNHGKTLNSYIAQNIALKELFMELTKKDVPTYADVAAAHMLT